jgi:adenine deaminase
MLYISGSFRKLGYGMKILVREGSAAKNFEALVELLQDHSDHMMFCSDDKHPDSLVEGHINELCKRAVAKGIDVFKVLKVACINPVFHYKLKLVYCVKVIMQILFGGRSYQF